MKKKVVFYSTLLVSLCALVACNKNTGPRIYGKSKYVTEYNYFLGEGKKNITTFTYENNDKKVTQEVRTNQGQIDLTTFVTIFKDTNEYNSNYQIISSINEDYTSGYYMNKGTYEYDSKGLLIKFNEYAQNGLEGEIYLIGTTDYTYDSDNEILSEIEKDDDGNIKYKTLYEYGINKVTRYKYDYSEDEDNPEDVEVKEIQFDLQTNTKTITQKYIVSDYEPCDYISSIDIFNSKDQVIKHTQYDCNCYYTYNENGDKTLEVTRRIINDVETNNGEDLIWTFNDSGYLTKYEEYIVEGDATIINSTTVYSVDEDGYIVEENSYDGDTEGPLNYSSTYVLSKFRDVYNLEIKDLEGLHKGTYNL